MKLITAMVRSASVEGIQSAVAAQGAHVTYLSDVLDTHETTMETYRGSSYRRPTHKLRMEIVVPNDLVVEDVIAAIIRSAAVDDSEAAGGGMFVTPLDQWIRIPTGRPGSSREPELVGGGFRRAS